MTDIETALNGSDLGEFEDSPILSTSIKITNAGDGLSAALGIDPQFIRKGEYRNVLLRCETTDVAFKPVKDTDGVTRLHTLKAITATIVDGAAFEDALTAQAEKIALAKEAAEGTQRLPFDEELDELHKQGAHAGGLVPGCSACDWEAATERAEVEDAAKAAERDAAFDEALAVEDEAGE